MFKKVKSILYVEDEKNIQEELAEFLEIFCEELYLADDGSQGLEEFKKYSPDIIITDIKMPIMDGLEMCKAIKELDNNAHIIFTTAFSDVGFFQEAIELQVDGYILKPISLSALETKLVSLINTITLKAELDKKEEMLLQTSKLAAMGEMIGNITHQWKQPLTTISMHVNNLKVDAELETITAASVMDYANGIEDQVQFLGKTIDDFRTFFIPNSSHSTYNMKEFLDKCIDLVQASFDSNTIKTIKEIDEKINSFGDPNQLTQAVINILNNARDSLKESEGLSKKLIFIVSAKEDSERNLVIIIKDNGGGVPEDILDRIFEPYFTTKMDKGGTGLGLYITHTIISKNLHGSIRVDNDVFEYEGEEYKGAMFTITLPIAEVE